MATQQKTTPHHDSHTFNSEPLESKPLQLSELLRLISLANEFGFTVKSAHDMKSGHNPILAEIYSVWFAIENDLLIFAHNVPWLTGLTSMKHTGYPIKGH